jgi:hypothetical protein
MLHFLSSIYPREENRHFHEKKRSVLPSTSVVYDNLFSLETFMKISFLASQGRKDRVAMQGLVKSIHRHGFRTEAF